MSNSNQVIIAGGGPVGLISAYALAQQGISVTVLEHNDSLLDDPRAATTHPATLEILDKLGVVEELIEQGLIAPKFQFWDRPTGKLVAEFDHSLIAEDTKFPYVVQCEQFKIAQIVYNRLRALDHANVLFGHSVTGCDQDESGVRVYADTPDGPKEFKGRYLIGADGGRSTVRKGADIEFEGFTWPERFLVLTTPFDFEKERGMSYRNYIADPDEWCNCFKVAGDGPPGVWRLVFPADPNAEEESLLSDTFAQDQMQKFFHRSEDYELVHRNLYNVHQRVAKTFRKGRILLAGDSAHINNSIGGMGLNGGIQDAMNLADKLADIMTGKADDTLLDLYDLQRRSYATEFVQQQTIENKKRLEARDDKTRRQNMANLAEIASDPERARKFLLRASMIGAMRSNAEIVLEAA